MSSCFLPPIEGVLVVVESLVWLMVQGWGRSWKEFDGRPLRGEVEGKSGGVGWSRRETSVWMDRAMCLLGCCSL